MPAALLEDRRRHLTDYLMPATVILAGVLVVVAGGFVISHVGRDGPAPLPAAQPPALPDVPLDPAPASQFPIPLESDSPSPTPSSADPSAERTTPPSRKERPFAGSVAVSRAGVAQVVDLTAEGARDWVHWGAEGTFSLERKKDGGFAILEGAPTAPRFRHGFSPQRFAWTDGNTDDSDGTPTGIRTCDRGNGFALSAPAATTSRTLKLYVGAVAARGKLVAKLSTGGPTATTTFTQEASTLGTTALVITYRAPKAGKLNLTWTTDASFDDDCGGVALEAATLR